MSKWILLALLSNSPRSHTVNITYNSLKDCKYGALAVKRLSVKAGLSYYASCIEVKK